MRRQRLKYITILPSLVTIINGACGFAAISFASQAAISATGQFSYHRLVVPYFAMAGYMILLAMVADMLDGRLARMSQSTSSFGGQLDSLCDIVSFGVAPAFLMLKILEHKLAGFAETASGIMISFLERFIWLAAAAYISCAAIRLARFNVENEEDESAHMSFVGLPTPAAAGVIASLVIFHQEAVPDILTHPGRDWSAGGLVNFLLDDLVIYALPVLALGLAVLMVSRIRYSHVINQYIRGKKPFAHLIRALIVFRAGNLESAGRVCGDFLRFCGQRFSEMVLLQGHPQGPARCRRSGGCRFGIGESRPVQFKRYFLLFTIFRFNHK